MGNRHSLDFVFHTPTELHFGTGVLSKAPELAATLGKHALLVTSRKAMHDLGYVDELTAGLGRHEVAFTCYRDFSAGPTTDEVDWGAKLAQDVGADMVIALGGGSALDGGKAIAAVACSSFTAADFLYGRATVQAALPVVALPTTAGTGSEMNKSAIITDPARRFKDGIRSPRLYPRFAVVDPRLTLSVPRQVTAHTGFDILAHAVESFVSPRAQPITDALALAAIHSVCKWLPEVLADLSNLEARANLAYAGTTMGINLGCVGTCLPHRIDKALCALHPEISHGQSVALFYPAWGEMSCLGSIERFAEVVNILQPGLAMDDRAKAAFFVDCIERYLRSLDMGGQLSEFGVSSREIQPLVDRVAGDLNVNPVPVSLNDLRRLLKRLIGD